MVKPAEQLDTGRWIKFRSGEALPAFAWGNPFGRAFDTSKLSRESSGLVVVALGSHERDRANVQVGDLTAEERDAVWQTLNNGQNQPGLPGIEDFAQPYDKLAAIPGIGGVDVILAAALGDEIHVGHLGYAEQEEIAGKLKPYSREVMGRMGIQPPDMPAVTDLSTNAQLVHPNGSS